MSIIIILFILGATGASFAMCAASRLLIGQSLTHPRRSYCPLCKHYLSWWQLLPILGWLIQKGKCHYCHQHISFWPSLAELYCGISMALLFQDDYSKWICGLIVFSTLSFLSFTDWQEMVIFPCAIIGLIPVIKLFPWCFPQSRLSLAMCIFYTVLLLSLNYFHHSIGLGDCEILIALLFLTGPIISAIIMLLSSLVMLMQNLRPAHRKPFVPAISFSLMLVCNIVTIKPIYLAYIWSNPLLMH